MSSCLHKVHTIGCQMPKSKKGNNSARRIPTEKQKIQVRLFFMLMLYIKFQDPSSNHFWTYASVTDKQMDRPTGPNQYAPSTSWGHKKWTFKVAARQSSLIRIFYLQVVQILATKFQVNLPFGSEVQDKFSRWQPWQPSGISDRNDFSYFGSTNHPNTFYLVSSQFASIF